MTVADFELPAGWGTARLQPARSLPAGGGCAARSYDHLGTALAWDPGAACAGAAEIACDLEHEARFAWPVRVPGASTRALTMECWLATEVVAKLTRQPVLAFLRAHGVVQPWSGGPATVDVTRFGARGTARLFLARSADGRRGAAFGVLEARPGG